MKALGKGGDDRPTAAVHFTGSVLSREWSCHVQAWIMTETHSSFVFPSASTITMSPRDDHSVAAATATATSSFTDNKSGISPITVGSSPFSWCWLSLSAIHRDLHELSPCATFLFGPSPQIPGPNNCGTSESECGTRWALELLYSGL